MVYRMLWDVLYIAVHFSIINKLKLIAILAHKGIVTQLETQVAGNVFVVFCRLHCDLNHISTIF